MNSSRWCGSPVWLYFLQHTDPVSIAHLVNCAITESMLIIGWHWVCVLTVPFVISPPGALTTSQCRNSRADGMAGDGASAQRNGSFQLFEREKNITPLPAT